MVRSKRTSYMQPMRQGVGRESIRLVKIGSSDFLLLGRRFGVAQDAGSIRRRFFASGH
jgi:hypothetical protein